MNNYPAYEHEDASEIKHWLELWGEEHPDGPAVPLKWAICGRCEGEGHHGPGWVLTGQDVDEMGEEFYEYMENMQEGRYDVPCEHHCDGGKVRIPDFEAMTDEQRSELGEWLRSAADYAAEREAERRAGC